MLLPAAAAQIKPCIDNEIWYTIAMLPGSGTVFTIAYCFDELSELDEYENIIALQQVAVKTDYKL